MQVLLDCILVEKKVSRTQNIPCQKAGHLVQTKSSLSPLVRSLSISLFVVWHTFCWAKKKTQWKSLVVCWHMRYFVVARSTCHKAPAG